MSDLSQHNRKQRIVDAGNFTIINNSMESLLQQAEAIAGFICYYNLKNHKDGYFDQFLNDLHTIRNQGIDHFTADGNMEPAQALLLTFIEQLHDIARNFNLRWKQYLNWYIGQVATITPLLPKSNKVCLSFRKNTQQPVVIDKGFRFTLESPNTPSLVYSLLEKSSIENITIEKVVSLYFSKQKDVFPASDLEYVTSLKTKDLLSSDLQNSFMFGEDRSLTNSKTLGFILCSPALLLREGKRTVSITFSPENKGWVDFKKIEDFIQKKEPGYSKDAIEHRIFNNIFYIRISCSDGWRIIEHYSVKLEESKLVLKFSLLEDFPETVACVPEIHNFESQFPALKVHLNFDAWLYPYSWIKDLLLKKIHIKTAASGISNVSVYNELGMVDCSKPFAPFGINTEKGAWIALGNYEMALKNTHQVNLKINWGQLPYDETGLYGYYSAYQKKIDNRSFIVQASYLSDYQWKDAQAFFLFSSTPHHEDGTPVGWAPLANESLLNGMFIEKMLPTKVKEDEYSYNIHAKTGFIGLALISPDIGFGEKYYRTLFTDYLIKNTLKKNKQQPMPNSPILPIIERITLDYEAEDTIDLRKQAANEENSFFHVTPFGNEKVYPNDGNNDIPLIFSMEPKANLLIALNHVKGDEMLSLYIDFMPIKKELTSEQLPEVHWYWGNGYQWQKIPDGCITEDKTGNLLVSGFLNIHIPENIDKSLFTNNGKLWLRAGVEKNECAISSVKNIYVNIAEAALEVDDINSSDNYESLITGKFQPETNIPGIENISLIAFYGGREKETEEALLMRTSEYATHKGKAITRRDFELMTLQVFPDIAKVKCLPNFSPKFDKKSGVTLVVIPNITQEYTENLRLMASSRQILNIEKYFRKRTSAYVNMVDVINPAYEEIMIHCHVNFKKRYSTVACRTLLVEMINRFIAPWQGNDGLPEFDYGFAVQDIRQSIEKLEFIKDIQYLSVVRMIETKDQHFEMDEYKNDNDRVMPSKSFAVFVPAKEHIILAEEESFGINEMTVTDTFIIS